MIAYFMLQISSSKLVFIGFVLVLLLIWGMFMDLTAGLIILAPILHPVAVKMGIHPIHFGVVFCVAISIGLMTPPLGASLFVTCGIARISLEQISKAIWPFIIAEIIALIIIAYIPHLILIIPKLIGLA
jgi:TRAP-type C4-dicarboxylate transport system permease large subunit